MNKDVIYVDVDDDVTAIIGKIKNAKEKIIALVPPKRAGVLQSAVNLRLLDRMARGEKKQLVLITGNQALVALAASAKIPVAKNLQSKPEVAEISALKVDDGDDIIDGSELPVGDHAKTSRSTIPVKDKSVRADDSLDVASLDIDGEDVVAKPVGKNKPTGARKSPKIPNFDTFRKKLVWIIGGSVALVALLIWMFVFAPAATIVITASTSPQPVSAQVRLGGNQPTNAESGIVASVMQREEGVVSVDFEATGQKDIGEKASGTISITNCDGPGFTLSSGTPFTASNGKVFYSTSTASVSGLSGSASGCRNTGAGAGTGSVNVQAASAGESFNIGSSGYTIGGISGDIYARGGAMTGGTTKVVKVVTEEDVERARGQLTDKSADDQKKALTKKFTAGQVVIAESFVADKGEATPTPAVGKEAPNGQAKLSVTTAFSMQAIPKTELEDFLKSYLESKVDNKENQKVYATGADKVTFANFQQKNDSASVTITTRGSVGPKIDEQQVKENARGKRFGDIQQGLKSIDGIKDVDVKFSFFWVNKVPNNIDKIKIEFKVNENGN
ncbi:hypothetical protein KI440_01215 [Candidatus Saccharibacteria bacterium TM7i]|nr:hypothetical protein KI440_01215 [Candidatus Saccharibacteria bacterium TM7i]